MGSTIRYRRSASSVIRLAGRGWRAACDVVFPPRCAYCEDDLPTPSETIRLCFACRNKLAPERWPCCGRCGAAGTSPLEVWSGCELCRGEKLRFETVFPLAGYAGDLRSAVLRMKRPPGEMLSAVMGRVLAEYRRAEISLFEPDLVVPIPMYWSRRVRRGTNSSEILAESVSTALQIPVCLGVLVRRRNTLPQKDLKPRERFRNVRGAFGIKPGYNFTGLKVLLVDDILTTGATCSEAAWTLLRAGAASVAAAVLARAQGTFAA